MSNNCNNEYSEKECHEAFRDAVEIIEKYDDNTQYEFFSTFQSGFEPVWQSRSFAVEKLKYERYIRDGLLKIADDPIIIVEAQTKRELITQLTDLQFEFPDNLPKTKSGNIRYKAKYEWCLEHPDIIAAYAYPELITVQVSDLIKRCGRLFREYNCCKYYNTIYKRADFEMERPYGIKITYYETKAYDYPDDIIKEMLNKYNHNRCINYTEPREVHTIREGCLHFALSINKEELETQRSNRNSTFDDIIII